MELTRFHVHCRPRERQDFTDSQPGESENHNKQSIWACRFRCIDETTNLLFRVNGVGAHFEVFFILGCDLQPLGFRGRIVPDEFVPFR